MDDLQCYSSRIEGCFSEIKEIKLTKRKKNERGKNIQSLSEEVLQNISKIENTLVELKALDSDKASVVEPHYQQKINIWKSQLSEIDILTKRKIRVVSSLVQKERNSKSHPNARRKY